MGGQSLAARALRILDGIVEAALGLALAALVLIGGAQILWRFAFNDGLSWSMDVSILLLIWATMLSAYTGVRRNIHLSADFLGLAFSDRVRRLLQLSALLLSLLYTVVYGWTSLDVVDAMDGIPYTSINLGQDIGYLALPVSAALVTLALLVEIGKHFFRRGEPT